MVQDDFNFGELTKQMVLSRLKEVPDAPGVAAEIARKTIIAGVKATRASGQSPRETVEQIIRGAMSGLLLIDKDLVDAALNILEHSAELAQELHIDPQEMMTWAMEGVARLSPLLGKDVRWRIRDAIDHKYMGVGEVFDELCAKADKGKL